jgi:hypothetical protein
MMVNSSRARRRRHGEYLHLTIVLHGVSGELQRR